MLNAGPIRAAALLAGTALPLMAGQAAAQGIEAGDRRAGELIVRPFGPDEPQLFRYHVQKRSAGELVALLRAALPLLPPRLPGEQTGAADSPAALVNSRGSPIAAAGQSGFAVSVGSATTGGLAAGAPSQPSALGAELGPAAAAQAGAGSFAGVAAIPAEGWWNRPMPPLDAELSPDAANNIVVTLATPRSYAIVLDALRQLDTAAPQVTVEAALVEVTLTRTTRYGIQTLIETGSGDAVLTDVGASAAGAPQLGRAMPGFSAVYQGRDIAAVLNALETRARVRVLSSPRITVINGQSAALQAGARVPIAVATVAGGIRSPGGVQTQIDYRETGVMLQIVPQVGARGLVRLDVEQEVAEVTASAGATSAERISPTFTTRRIATAVAVHDGDTLVIGGLLLDNRTRGRTGLPFLSRLPALGGTVFGRTDDQRRRTDLILLLRARVFQAIE